MAEARYRSNRFWTYRRAEWDPSWWHKLGVPYRGGDEWGRRVIVIGVCFAGYLCWAWRTCWCQECHEMRAHTYRWLDEDEACGPSTNGHETDDRAAARRPRAEKEEV